MSDNDADTTANELRTHLVVSGNADDGDGMFSMRDLLGGGMATDEGANFVAETVKRIEKVRADVSALLALDTNPTGLDTILDSQWTKLEMALDLIFGTDSDAPPHFGRQDDRPSRGGHSRRHRTHPRRAGQRGRLRGTGRQSSGQRSTVLGTWRTASHSPWLYRTPISPSWVCQAFMFDDTETV